MILFSLALIILLMSSLPWVAIAKTSGKPAWLMALYLVGSAIVVLTSYIANSFLVLNKQGIILTIHIMIGTLGWVIWQRVGKPAICESFKGWKLRPGVKLLRYEPVLSLLGIIVAAFYIFAFFQIVLIPQNNMDSLAAHLTRIGFWRQQGSFFPWPTFMPNQIWYPVNAQLQTYWTLLFLGNDRLVGAVQWLAVLVSGIGVFGLARLYGYNVRRSAFAILIFLSFPLVALQATTTQTDLVTTAFFILAVYFLFAGLKNQQNSLLILSAISIGIGTGVKKNYFLLLLIFAVLAMLAAFQFGKHSYKRIIFWSLSAVLGISLLGAYNYVVNWRVWGGPFGPPSYVEFLLETSESQQEVPKAPKVKPQLKLIEESIVEMVDTFPGSDILLELTYNIPRLFYQAVDTSGLPRPLDGYAHKVKMYLTRPFFQWIGFDEIEGTAYTAPGHTFSFTDKNINEESHAWYGPLSVLLLFPALFVGLRRELKSRNYLLLAPGIALLIYLPLEIIFRPGWDPFQGRYFAPLIALGSPLMARWFKEEGSAWYEWIFGVLAIVIITVTMLYNPSKPTLGKFADEFHVWNNDRIFIQTIQMKTHRSVYYKVGETIPRDATLGYYIPFYFLEYPLFGDGLDRRLMPVVNPSHISDLQWLREHEIDYLLLPGGDEIPVPPPEYNSINRLASWTIYEYESIP